MSDFSGSRGWLWLGIAIMVVYALATYGGPGVRETPARA